MDRNIVFIHGAWVTPLSWDKFRTFFEGKGYRCMAPPWPYRHRTVEILRQDPDPQLAGLGIAEILDHYERIIRRFDDPPVLIGHSFGGLFVQVLLDRGVGSAGIAIDSAPPRGVTALHWSVLRSNAPVLFAWLGWRRVMRMSRRTFNYAFVNTLPPEAQKAAYDRHVVPETGRIFFEAALATLDPHSPAAVDFHNPYRPPLLLIAGSRDHIVPPQVNRSNFERYAASPARTDFKEFPGRSHWIIDQDGWEEVAAFIAGWLRDVTGGSTGSVQSATKYSSIPR